ncbi:MAG: amidohydrolase family protein [Actinobacteria bacterium]|nr:amidohydrolase family protein [Actinomycetota bacterium]
MTAPTHDLVVRGALVVDGTGAPGRDADVAVTDGRITQVGDVVGRGADELDGRGQVLAPGFIDPHTHLDANLFWDPDVTPSATYGVTTVVTGNCGYTLAPVATTAARDYVVDVMSFVEQIPRAAFDTAVPFDWSTQTEYFDRLAELPVALNHATFVGHVPVRTAVMGPGPAHEREATTDEVARMVALVREGLALGAVGFSTDQCIGNFGPGFEALPGQVCAPGELLAIAATLRDAAGPGVFAMVPPSLNQDRPEREADVDWHLRLAEASGRPVVIGPVFDRWSDLGIGVDMIDLMAARSRPGVTVVPQISTRIFELWTRLDTMGLVVRLLPTLGDAVRRGGADGVRALAADPERRARLAGEGARVQGNMVWSGRWDHVRLRWSVTRPDLLGLTIDEIAARLGGAPTDVLVDLAVADDFETQVAAEMANGDDEQVGRMVGHPASMIGASDAGAHVLSNTDSCYAVWTLQHWVRERGVLTLEQAVRKLTADQADLFGLSDRGRVAVGTAADLVLFDPDRVGTVGVRFLDDQPAGGRRLVTEATGITASVVNGTVTTRDGAPTGARAGRFLRPGRTAGSGG